MWYNIKNKQPEEKISVLFHTPDNHYESGYHVGYWSNYDNCMLEYYDDQEGKKWIVDIWMYIPDKQETPLIIHNVLSYKGKNYLRQLGSCPDCSMYGIECHSTKSTIQFGHKLDCTGTKTIWKSFDDIVIDDSLACTRKDIGDIYLFNKEENNIDTLIYVERNVVTTSGWRSTKGNMRLATAEELQKYFKGE